jgi:hypothetical protein
MSFAVIAGGGFAVAQSYTGQSVAFASAVTGAITSAVASGLSRGAAKGKW